MLFPLSHKRPIFSLRFPNPSGLPFSSDAMIAGRFERRLKRRDESNLNGVSAETSD
jgi:hypothetical protein